MTFTTRDLANARRRRAHKNRPFVAIDSEGVSFGDEKRMGAEGDVARCQRTVFWGAGNSDHIEWLDGREFCTSEQIIEFLLSLPSKFGDSIFVWFGSSYDATQIFADLPYEKAWELQHGRPYPQSKDYPELRGADEAATSRLGRYVFWRGYGLSYIKQKSLTIGRLRDRDNPRDRQSGQIEFSQRITIFDVFGFFQSSFAKAADSIPGAYRGDDKAIVEEGKRRRADFALENRDAMKRYTAAEIRVLARMMEELRLSLSDLDLELTRWQGAGSIASALFKKHGTKAHFWPVKSSELEAAQIWAHHAFFGGRIELLKQGASIKSLLSYDIKSAYPSHMAGLPSMKGGRWRTVENPSWKDLENANVLSMFEVDFEVRLDEDGAINRIYGRKGPEFYPFPYRENNGSIVFPPRVRGIYMAEEVRAAFDWVHYFREHYLTRARAPFALSVRLELKRAMIFEPAEDMAQELPFNWLIDMYEERRELLAKIKRSGVYDILEKVLKLGYNSGYGKTAQSVGSAGAPPGTACPWYAAAITAGTRAQLLRAALTAPRGSCVAFMTDGIVTTRPLDVIISDRLGRWEVEKVDGGIFVQPGVYSLGEKARHRGIKKDLLGASDMNSWLAKHAGDGWRNGDAKIEYPYRYYVTLGSAVASRERWEFAGWWVDGSRDLQLDNLGRKRAPPIGGDKSRRALELVDTEPKPAYFHVDLDGEDIPISAMYRPDWLDSEFAAETELENLNEEISLARIE